VVNLAAADFLVEIGTEELPPKALRNLMTAFADALAEGFDVVLLTDAVRAVEVNPGDGERAIASMLASGAMKLDSSDMADRS
jgi:hypothetical protein